MQLFLSLISVLQLIGVSNCMLSFSYFVEFVVHQILKAMGLTKTASSAMNLLIDIGYFPVHVNLELLKLNLHTVHSDEIISAGESLLVESADPDEVCPTRILEHEIRHTDFINEKEYIYILVSKLALRKTTYK